MKCFFLIIFLFLGIELFAAESNIHIFSDLIKKSSDEICDELAIKNISEIEVSFSDAESSRLFEQIFFKTCSERQIKLLTECTNKLNLALSDISVNYKLTDNQNISEREIYVNSYAKLTLNNEIILISPKEKYYRDSIEIVIIPELQVSDYKFTKSKIPEAKSSFYKKYLQPALITTVAAITVVLFFTIRSN